MPYKDNRVQTSFTFEGRRYFVRGKDKKEAERKAGEKLAQLKAGAIIRESSATVNNWAEQYFNIYKKGVKESTLLDYKSVYANTIKPYIGALPLKAVKQIHCRNIFNNMSDKSKSYVHQTFILLSGIFNTAIDNDMIIKNPMRGVSEPNAKAGKRRALTPEERRIFLEAAELCGEAGYYGKIIYYCGLRPSETMRIHAEDFDREKKLLHIRGEKTQNASRTVPVPDALPIPEQKSGLIFPNKNGGVNLKATQYGWWLRIKKQMALIAQKPIAEDLVAYCLRHDYGTRAIEAGINIEVLSKMMGHSSVKITSEVYSHESEFNIKNAQEKLNNYYRLVDTNGDTR